MIMVGRSESGGNQPDISPPDITFGAITLPGRDIGAQLFLFNNKQTLVC